MTDCYTASGSVEGQYQPGSDDQVLLNKLDEVELDLLYQLYDAVFETVEVD